VRLGYAQVLLDLQRPAQAMQQLEAVAAEPQAPAEAWLLIGNAHARANRAEAATTALERYLQKTENQDDDSVERGRTQAFLQLAQLAEKRQDFTAANAWLDRIENPQELLPAQSRRASILARQGRVDEALALLRNTPERLPSDARAKLAAEAQLLRELKRYEEAYALYENAPARLRDDPEVVYEQAMVAERAGRLADFERLMRALIERQPDSPLAFNALGYSLADRNLRLDEAKTLIQQAVKLAPDDAYIQDSLAWVEFRLGNRAEALRLLQAAYAKRPDVEIAAHLGEVLWVNGERDKALSIWREGLLLDSEAEVLRETFKRFQVQP
jgi:tetratricopeptide (TPR) repeat protein